LLPHKINNIKWTSTHPNFFAIAQLRGKRLRGKGDQRGEFGVSFYTHWRHYWS